MVSGCESGTRTTRTAVVSTPMRGTERVLAAVVAVTCAGGAEAMRALLRKSITEIASSLTSMATLGCGGCHETARRRRAVRCWRWQVCTARPLGKLMLQISDSFLRVAVIRQQIVHSGSFPGLPGRTSERTTCEILAAASIPIQLQTSPANLPSWKPRS
jgi:hypothetical protein